MSYYADDRRAAAAARVDPRSVRADVGSLLRREMAIDMRHAPPPQAPRLRPTPPPPEHGISDQYIVLDTYLKMRDSNISRGEFRWNFMIQGVTDDDVVGVHDEVNNVIEIQIGSFGMPILPEVPYVTAAEPVSMPSGLDQLILKHNNLSMNAPTLVPYIPPYGQYPATVLPTATQVLIPWIHNPYTQMPFAGRFTIQIREAGLQSYSDRNGFRHHYDFIASAPWFDANPNMMNAHPQCGDKWDTYIFTDPLTDMHGITLIFRNPDIPMIFQPDCLYDIPIAVGIDFFIRIDVGADHGLKMGDRIHIRGYTSGNYTLDTYMNRLDGHVVGSDPAGVPLAPGVSISGTSIWTDPAISVEDFTTPITMHLASIFIAKRRMRIPLRLRKVVSHRTNYISV